MTSVPRTLFAEAEDAYIAYQTFRSGPRDFVLTPAWVSHIELIREVPEFAGYLERLSELGRVILFDKRGVGLSDRPAAPVSLERRAQDLIAVMDAAGCERAALVGWLDAGISTLVTAAMFPARVDLVIAGETAARIHATDGVPSAYDPALIDTLSRAVETGWGDASVLQMLTPALLEDPRILHWFQRWERMSATPSMASLLLRSYLNFDIRRYLPDVQAPVCLMHDVNFPFLDAEAVTWLAERLPDAEVRNTDAGEQLSIVLPSRRLVDDIEEYLTGTRSGFAAHRAFCAVMFTDMADSTKILGGIGDDRWGHLLTAHRAAVRTALRRFGGVEVDTAGDGFFATFRLPSDAMRCARALQAEAAEHGLRLRIGIHCGEVVQVGDQVRGLAVHVGSRIAGIAGPGEVVVSETVLTSVLGTKVEAEDAGIHRLKGVPGSWPLHRLLKIG